MSLLLSQRTIGEGWELIEVGEFAGPLSQWMDLAVKEWHPMPPQVVGMPCRFGNSWRRPVSKRAKVQAIWAARSNLFFRYVLRKIA